MKPSFRSFLTLSGSALLMVGSVNATQFWDGTGLGANWNTPENWGGDAIPVWGTAINFGGTNAGGTAVGTTPAAQTSAVNDLAAGTNVKGILLTNNGTTGRTQSFTLSGNSILLGTGTNDSITTTAISGANPAIEDVISLNIDFGTPTAANHNRVFNTGTNHNLRIDGVLSGALSAAVPPQAYVMMKQGLGKLTLTNANNSYLGYTNITGGTGSVGSSVLEITSIANGGLNSSIGASSNAAANLRFSNAVNGSVTNTLRYIGDDNGSTDRSIYLGGNTGVNATNSAIESSGDGTLSFTRDAAIEFSNPGVPRNLHLGGTNTGDNVFNLSLSNNGAGVSSFTKQGDGKWILTNANTYTGDTLVSAGTLLVNGSLGASAVTVDGGAFGGTGTIGSTLDLVSGSFHVADLSAALQVTGTVTLYAGFGIDDLAGLTWGSVANDTYTLINGTLGAGVFDDLANNSLATAFDIGGGRSAYFQDGSLNLVVIPEPSAALLGGLGLLALLRRRR